jgi:hypothetical protein
VCECVINRELDCTVFLKTQSLKNVSLCRTASTSTRESCTFSRQLLSLSVCVCVCVIVCVCVCSSKVRSKAQSPFLKEVSLGGKASNNLYFLRSKIERVLH